MRDSRLIDDLIDEWHDDHGATDKLHERLGLSWADYGIWASGGGLPAGYTPPALKEKKLTDTPAPVTELPQRYSANRLDGDGYLDLSDLRADWHYLLELCRQKVLIEEAIKAYEAKFKAPVEAVTGAIGFKVDGLPAATWKKDGTFPTAKYVAANPHVFEAYKTTKEVFDVDTFKKHRPDEYNQWRASSLKYAK